MADTNLLARIRGEFNEMPGMRLTPAQACRLWDLEAPECAAALATLVAERFLYRLDDGSFVAWPRIKPLAAMLPRPVIRQRA